MTITITVYTDVAISGWGFGLLQTNAIKFIILPRVRNIKDSCYYNAVKIPASDYADTCPVIPLLATYYYIIMCSLSIIVKVMGNRRYIKLHTESLSMQHRAFKH